MKASAKNPHGQPIAVSASEWRGTLERTAEEIHAIFQAMPNGVALVEDVTGKIIAVNAAFEKLTGRSSSDLAGSDIGNLVFGTSGSATRRLIQKIDTCEEAEQEDELMKQDGTSVSVVVVCREVTVAGIVRKALFFRDISKRKHFNEVLHISRHFMDKSSGIIFWVDSEANIVYANEGATSQLGYSLSELTGMTIHDVDINFPRRLWPMMWEHFKKAQSTILESVFRTRDGRIFPVEVSGSFVTYGAKEYNFVFAWDVSRRKQAEAGLKESQQRMSAFINSATDLLFLYDSDLRLVEINPAALQYMGVNREQVLGRHFLELDPTLGFNQRHDEYRDIINQGGRMSYSDVKSVRSNEERYFDLRVFRVGDGLGIIASEVTQRKAMEKELLRHQTHLEELVAARTEALAAANAELKDQIEQRRLFIHSLIHDLKTPLTPLLGASEMLEKSLTEERWKKLAESVHNGSLNLQRTVNELFDIEKGQMGLLELECVSTDMIRLLREVSEYARPEAAANCQEFFVDLPESLPRVMADPVRLRQIILNLLNNAFKYTQTGGKICLTAEADNDVVHINVTDNGLGISPEDQLLVFEPYRRFSRASRQHLSGLGLGLALSKRLIELHGGEIWVTSEKGAGSTFGLKIPINRTVNKEGTK